MKRKILHVLFVLCVSFIFCGKGEMRADAVQREVPQVSLESQQKEVHTSFKASQNVTYVFRIYNRSERPVSYQIYKYERIYFDPFDIIPCPFVKRKHILKSGLLRKKARKRLGICYNEMRNNNDFVCHIALRAEASSQAV